MTLGTARRTKKKASSNLKSKLTKYAVAGVAATSVGINATDAQICDSATTVTLSAIGDSTDIDIDGDGVNDFNLSVLGTFNGAGFASSTFFVVSGLGSNMVAGGGGGTYNGVNNYIPAFADSMTAGAFGSTDPLMGAGPAVVRYPTTAGNHYVDPTAVSGDENFGLSFDIGGAQHFGAFQFDITGGNPSTLTFNFQWEKTAGAAFVVPEPSGLALLALGAVGLVRRRNRKDK